jgi:DNA-binding NarL/FixJ family response regulator
MAIQVAILEDDMLLRDRYQELISSTADMRVVWACTTLAEATQRLSESSPDASPDVLLLDIGLPDGSGLSAVSVARHHHPGCEVMVVSVFGDERHVVAAIEAGASGYLLKDAHQDTFLNTIRELRAGGSPISPIIARILLQRAREVPTHGAYNQEMQIATPLSNDSLLGERESEILKLVAKGFNFAEIGRLLDISTNTVKTHIYRIYRKLSVHSRGEAVFEATKLGLVDL